MKRFFGKHFTSHPIADYAVIIATPIIATLVTILFRTNQITSLFFFFILPALYLTFRQPRYFKKVLVILICAIPFTIIIDYFAMKDSSWWVETVFPFRIFGFIPLEDFIWVTVWFYYVIAFYEYFIDHSHFKKDTPINRKAKLLISGWYGSLLIFSILYLILQSRLYVPYFYLVFPIVIGGPPLILLLYRRPQILYKFAKAIAYFFAVNFLHEISALSAGQWSFPGAHFIGWVQFLNFRFPLEELTMWMFFGAALLLAYYEIAVDDGR